LDKVVPGLESLNCKDDDGDATASARASSDDHRDRTDRSLVWTPGLFTKRGRPLRLQTWMRPRCGDSPSRSPSVEQRGRKEGKKLKLVSGRRAPPWKLAGRLRHLGSHVVFFLYWASRGVSPFDLGVRDLVGTYANTVCSSCIIVRWRRSSWSARCPSSLARGRGTS